MSFVRVSSSMDSDELERRVEERRPRFLEVPGLIQKNYGRDPQTVDWCGIYFFEDQQSLSTFRDSKLAKTIPVAYEATNKRAEMFVVMFPLLQGKGPV